MKMRLAIIDDEITVCKQLTRTLAAENFEVESFQAGAPFLVRMSQYPFDIVLIDLKLPDMDGIEILSHIKTGHEDTEAIIITGHGAIESAVQAMKKGAYHFITKPFRLPEIRSLASSARETCSAGKIRVSALPFPAMILWPGSLARVRPCLPYST